MDSVTPPPLEPVPPTKPMEQTIAVKTPSPLVSITGSMGLTCGMVPIKKIESVKPQDNSNSTIELKLLLDPKTKVS